MRSAAKFHRITSYSCDSSCVLPAIRSELRQHRRLRRHWLPHPHHRSLHSGLRQEPKPPSRWMQDLLQDLLQDPPQRDLPRCSLWMHRGRCPLPHPDSHSRRLRSVSGRLRILPPQPSHRDQIPKWSQDPPCPCSQKQNLLPSFPDHRDLRSHLTERLRFPMPKHFHLQTRMH